MSPLNIHPEESQPATKKKNNKLLKALLGISALVAVPVIGTTLAASITIGSGPIQFGQGVQQAVTCDDAVTVTPTAGFTNVSGAGSFSLLSIAVTEILAACDGKTFTLKVYNNTDGSNPQTVASPAPTPSGAVATALKVLFDKDSTFSTEVGDSDITVTGDATSFTVTLGTTLASGSVNKITIETN